MHSELEDVVNALRRIVRAIRVSALEAQDTLGLSGAQLFVLQQLSQAPELSVNELAVRTLTDQSSVSVVVQRLHARRLVTRKRAATDARRLCVSLTPAGRALLRKSPKLAQTDLIAALRKVPTKRLRVVKEVLAAAAADMGSHEPSMFFEPGERKRKRRAKWQT